MKPMCSNEFRRCLTITCAVSAFAIFASVSAQAAPNGFALGQSARSGAVCKAVAQDDDPAAQLPHAKAWSVECYGWEGTDLGHIYAYSGNFEGGSAGQLSPQIWRTALAERANCGALQDAGIAGLSGGQHAACKAKPSGTAYSVYVVKTSDGLAIAEGFGPVEELLQTGLRVVAGVAEPPKSTEQQRSSIALENSSGAASLAAAAGSARRAPGWLRRHAHIENQAWRFTEAERDFRALANDNTLSTLDRATAELNWALNISNEGRFEEADAHFQAVKTAVSGLHNPELDLLLLNYTALHELNQRHFAEAQKIAERTLEALAHLPTAVQEDNAAANVATASGAFAIDGNLASRLNQTTRATGFRSVALSEAQRLLLLKAQAKYVIGCAQAGAGNTAAARKSLAEAQNVLRTGGVERSTVWLNALIVLQTSRLDSSSEGRATAEAALSRMIADFQRLEHLSASPAEARLYLELGRIEAATGRTDQAILDFDTGLGLFRQSRGTLGNSADDAAPYFDLLIAKAASDPTNAAKYRSLFFDAAQSIVSLSTARTVARLAARVGLGDSNAAAIARAHDDAQRQLTIKAAQIQRAESVGGYSEAQKAADAAELRLLTDQFGALHQQLLAANPRYGQLASSSATVEVLQKSLRSGEVYVKTVLLGKGGYGIAITSDNVDIYAIPLSRNQAQADVAELRKPFDAVDTLPRFKADVSYKLFRKVFGPVADKVAAANRLIYEPDAALISLPAGVFVVDEKSANEYKAREAEFLKGRDIDLYQGLSWLARNTEVSLSVSPSAFLESRSLPPSQAKRTFGGFGAPVVSNPNDPRLFMLMSKDSPEAAGQCGRVRSALANYIYRNPMNDIAKTMLDIGKRLGAGPQDIVLGPSFTDAGVLQRTDLNDYKILFFGTHGLLPDSDACLQEPALVTSLGVENSDAFLDASEILNLKLDADLVVLSACSTAGVGSSSEDRTGLAGSGEALGGLARDFIYAGSRGLIVSQWAVEAEPTLMLMRTLFATRGASQGDALKAAQVDLMINKNFSHPYYWAGFSLVGDSARPMPAN